MYDLSAALGFEELTAVPAGSSLLVADTNGADTGEQILSILADGRRNDEGVIVVTTDGSAEAILDDFAQHVQIDPHTVCVIDCQATAGRERRELDNGVFVYSVPSPDDLTGIGIGLTACFERLTASGVEHARVGFVSLSSVLDATGEEETFKFSHVVSSRLDSAAFLGVFGLEQTADSERVLREAFDGTVELRQENGVTEGRVRDRRADTTAWQPLNP